jgi:hypothetical protein
MKGMRKISRGSGFRGALDYVFERENGKEKDGLLAETCHAPIRVP